MQRTQMKNTLPIIGITSDLREDEGRLRVRVPVDYIDAVVEAGLHPYDIMAAVPGIEAAGGTITDWTGAPLTTESGGRVVAAGSRRLHAQLLARLE